VHTRTRSRLSAASIRSAGVYAIEALDLQRQKTFQCAQADAEDGLVIMPSVRMLQEDAAGEQAADAPATEVDVLGEPANIA
jgi:hypothetical protein